MIQPSPTAPEGSVATLTSYTPETFPSDAAILCRNTAPLIGFAFSLIQRRIGCRVLGREIGQGLVSLIDKLQPKDLEQLAVKLEMYEVRECAKALRKGDEQSADAVRDRVSCINLFLGHAESLADLKRSISSLFDDTSRGLLTLSTVHKAKGLEWPMVFILDFHKYMPSPYARQPWQKVQEDNLIYVAITRAKLDLRYIESGKWQSKQEAPPESLPD